MHEQARREAVEKILADTQDEAQRIDAIARERGWFRPKDNSKYYPCIQQFLEKHLSLEETIQHISRPYNASSYEQMRLFLIGEAKSLLPEGAAPSEEYTTIDENDLSYSIFHSAKRIPYRNKDQHERLVSLVEAFIVRASRFATPGSNIMYNPGRELGPDLREVYNDCPGVGAGFSEPERHAWANLNCFLAHLTEMLRLRARAGLFPFDDPKEDPLQTKAKDILSSCLKCCIWTMREALEEELVDDPPLPQELTATARQKMDARILAAAMWVIVLGKELCHMDIDMSPKAPNEGNPARGGKLWKEGRPGLCKERWAFWKSRFAEFKDRTDDMDDEARQLAKSAFEAMDRAEKQDK